MINAFPQFPDDVIATSNGIMLRLSHYMIHPISEFTTLNLILNMFVIDMFDPTDDNHINIIYNIWQVSPQFPI